MSSQLEVLNGPIIAAGEALSEAIDCSEGLPVRITMPSEWTSATLSFQISSDGVFFNDCVDHAGQEIRITVIPGTAVPIPIEFGNMMGWIKFRSGPRANPIVQEKQRDFAIAISKPSIGG